MIEPLLDALEDSPMLAWELGSCWYIETFCKHYVGRVTEVTGTEIVLTEASWVAESGRFGRFIREGRTVDMDVEFVGEARIPQAYIAGRYPWPHKLFTEDV